MKKIFALMLVFATVFAFAACSKKEPVEVPTEPKNVETDVVSENVVNTSKISAIAGKTIVLKSVASDNYVEIKTNANGIATVMKVHKFFADAASFGTAANAGSYGKYKLEVANEATFEIIYSDSETVKGMTYEDIVTQAEKAEGYIVVPAE